MLELLAIVLEAARSAVRSRSDLVIENLAQRQQLAVLARCGRGRRVRMGESDRLFWIALRRVWSLWAEVLVLVKPETVVRWLSRRLSSVLDVAISPWRSQQWPPAHREGGARLFDAWRWRIRFGARLGSTVN